MAGRRVGNEPGRARILLAAYRSQGRGVLLGWIFGIGWQGAQVAAPLVIAAAIDRGVIGGDPRALLLWVLVLAGLCLVEVTLTVLRHRFAIIPAVQIGLGLRADLLARVHRDHRQPTGPRRRTGRPGELISRATSDVDKVAGLVDFTPSTVACLVSTVAVTVVLSVIHPLLALAVVVPLLPLGVLFWSLSRSLDALSTVQQQATADVSVLADATLNQIRSVHGMGAIAQLGRRWDGATEAARVAGIRLGRRRAVLLPLVEVFRALALVLVFLVGAWQVTSGTLTLGQLFAAVAYAIYLGPLLSQLGAFVAELRTALVAARRVHSAVPGAPAVVAGDLAPPVLPPVGERGRAVHIRGLSVTGTALRNLDVTIAPGQLCAVVLNVDQGVAELSEVLAGLRLPERGSVELDGVDICGHQLSEVVIVQRLSFLFSGTAAETVTFGRPDASPADVASALAWSRAVELVATHSVLPPGATTLSGGQRQRLALARALVAEPTVLVCVDALSALDPETADLVGAGLADRGRTTVLLTTDPSMTAHADLVLDLRAAAEADVDQPVRVP